MAAEDIEVFEDVFNEDVEADEVDDEDSEVDEELDEDEELEGDKEDISTIKQEKSLEKELLVKETHSNILPIRVRDRDKRMTSDSIDIYELAGVVGLRAKQIENGDKYYVDSEYCSNAIDIARKEILLKQSPMIVERTVAVYKTYKIVEQWSVNELVVGVI